MSVVSGDYHVLSTDAFWEAMRDPRFVRTSNLTGMISGKKLWCSNPPESVPGFLSDLIAECRAELGA